MLTNCESYSYLLNAVPIKTGKQPETYLILRYKSLFLSHLPN